MTSDSSFLAAHFSRGFGYFPEKQSFDGKYASFENIKFLSGKY